MFILETRASFVTRIMFSVMSFTSVRHVRITAVLVMIHWDATPAMRTETGNAWRDGRETTALTVSNTCVCQMLRGLFSPFGIVCLGL